ncbi:hypothetical protein [Specibacter sp. NPDC078692]|uniref:AbiTii domain-containing protein n=1 Tax=Specibacter sp. NPDC078692 TaxID=3155818 RepID=UPI0034274505
MSQITKIVDDAVDGDVPLSTLLRRIKVVASRIEAPEVVKWVDLEILGYPLDADLPLYRSGKMMPVKSNWSGVMGRSISDAPLSAIGLPEDFTRVHFYGLLRQPVSELEMFANSDRDPVWNWDPWAVAAYQNYLDTGVGGTGFEMMNLMSAQTVYPRTFIAGVLDAIRNAVLDLALGLESVGDNVGEPNGPTIDDKAVSNVVNNFHITVNGDGANVAAGSEISQKNSVVKNDLESLLAAGRGLGISEAELEALREAVAAEPEQSGPKTLGFIDRLKGNAVTMANGVASSMIATQFMAILLAYYGV